MKPYHCTPAYPTPRHEAAAEAIVAFFQNRTVDAVLLLNSCARGKASADSCLDVGVLLPADFSTQARQKVESDWQVFHQSAEVFNQLKAAGKYAHVDLEFLDGIIKPPEHDWTSGADFFEVEIGNYFVYSAPLWTNTDRFFLLKHQWLPYYDEALRQQRLTAVLRFCHNNLDHIPLFCARGLVFQAFDRLYHAYQEFLQALFIHHRIYPIAYDKWIEEQVVDILQLPQLYPQLLALFEMKPFCSASVLEKSELLRSLISLML